MNTEKLAKMQAQVRIGGKGTPRRKIKKAHAKPAADDKKLTAALKKFNMQPIPGIEEVNMFKSDGRVIHISQPKVNACIAANMFSINGHVEEKELHEMIPGILSQMGPESLSALRQLAESYRGVEDPSALVAAAAAAGHVKDDDVPDLQEIAEEID